MRRFVDGYGVESIVHIPADDDEDIWRSLNVTYQPWWAIVRTDGSWDSGSGYFPQSVIDEAVSQPA